LGRRALRRGLGLGGLVLRGLGALALGAVLLALAVGPALRLGRLGLGGLGTLGVLACLAVRPGLGALLAALGGGRAALGGGRLASLARVLRHTLGHALHGALVHLGRTGVGQALLGLHLGHLHV